MADILNLDEIQSNRITPPPSNLPSPEEIEAILAQPGFLKKPAEAASTLGTIGLNMAGAMAVPEVAMAAKFLPSMMKPTFQAGAPYLKNLLQYLKTGLWSAGGEQVGQAAAEAVGLTPEQTESENLKQFLVSAGVGTAIPGVLEAGGRIVGPRLNPAQKMATEYADAAGVGKGNNATEKIKFANTDAANLGDTVPAQLGAHGGETNAAIAGGDRATRGIAALNESGWLPRVSGQAKDTKQLYTLAGLRDKEINAARNAAINKLAPNPIDPSEFANSFGRLDEQVDQLNKLAGTEELAQKIQGTVQRFKDKVFGANPAPKSFSEQKFLDDLKVSNPEAYNIANPPQAPHVTTPKDLLDIYQAINKERKILQQEFNAGSQSAQFRGDAVRERIGDSIEALDTLQDDIVKALDARAGTPPGQKGIFSKLNDEQFGIRSLRSQLKEFNAGTQGGIAVKRPNRVAQNPGQRESGPVSPRQGFMQMVGDTAVAAKNRIFGGQSPAMEAAMNIRSRNSNAVEQIRRLYELNKAGGAQLPRQAWPRASGLAVGGQGMLGGGEAQAQQPPPEPPALPRQTPILMQNPRAIMARAAFVSGNNQQLMSDVQRVLQEPNPVKKRTALMELARNIPGLFTPSAFASEWDGQIHDKTERQMFAQELQMQQRLGKIDSLHLAKQLSALNVDGTIIQPTPRLPGKREVITQPSGESAQMKHMLGQDPGADYWTDTFGVVRGREGGIKERVNNAGPKEYAY